jgi:hypothetical protein
MEAGKSRLRTDYSAERIQPELELGIGGKVDSDDMDYCIVCKNRTKKRYALQLKDSKNSTGISAHVCRDCFNRFLSSHANEGMFRAAKLLGWARHRDRIRE